jgi:hypothetical protein
MDTRVSCLRQGKQKRPPDQGGPLDGSACAPLVVISRVLLRRLDQFRPCRGMTRRHLFLSQSFHASFQNEQGSLSHAQLYICLRRCQSQNGRGSHTGGFCSTRARRVRGMTARRLICEKAAPAICCAVAGWHSPAPRAGLWVAETKRLCHIPHPANGPPVIEAFPNRAGFLDLFRQIVYT